MPTCALLIHGYSEQSLDAYGSFPEALADAAATANCSLRPIILTAFDSLDDGVTIDDLAEALEAQVLRLEAGSATTHWQTGSAAFICHSTGALVARRWMLNRIEQDLALPSHLIMLAGANHGSALAEAGRTPLGQAHQYFFKNGRSAGGRVLTDLDFGSDFLLRLNREWLKAWADKKSPLSKVCVFSLIGDQLGPDQSTRLLWASRENGCDNTVRISAANMNYTILDADGASGMLKPLPAGAPVPHLIVSGYSHYGPDNGIVAGVRSADDAPIKAVLEALSVPSPTDDSYAKLADAWNQRNGDWLVAPAIDDRNDPTVKGKMNEAVHANSTLVFHIHDRFGRIVDDCFITLLDANSPTLDADDDGNRDMAITAILKVAESAESRWPIHNTTQCGAYTFYINTQRFENALSDAPDPMQPSHHQVTIQAAVPGNCMTFTTASYRADPQVVRLAHVNETTYIDVTLYREGDPCAIYDHLSQSQKAPPWRPFPDGRL